jgi:hypothetical protein
MSTGTLDFLVIGAMKGGTTSLFEYLRTHPELYLPAAKDVPFFCQDGVFERGWDEYVRWAFLGAPRDRLWGKVTPQYMGSVRWHQATHRLAEAHPGEIIPDRIARLFPRIKLIALLRDPIQRAVSHYWFCVQNDLERRSLDRALEDSLSPRVLEDARIAPTRTNSYVALGEYGRLLDAYLSRFPRSQLCVQSTYLLARDPVAVLRDMWRFLDVDDSHVPPNLGVRYHVASPRRRVAVNPWRIPPAIRATPLRYAWAAMPRGAADAMKLRYKTAAYRFSEWNRVSDAPPDQEPDPALAERLKAHYASDLSRVESLFGPVPGVTTSARLSPTPS